MTQAEMARALGLSPARITALVRRGMPLASVEDAQAWRRRNIAPYVRATAPAPAPVASPARAPGGLPYPATASLDELDAVLGRLAVMFADDAIAVAAALGAAADARLAAGEPLGDLEPPLRATLAAIPKQFRGPVKLPMSVWGELTRDFVALAREQQRPDDTPMTDDDAWFVGAVAYEVAAGIRRVVR